MSILDALSGGAYQRANKANAYAINSGLSLGADALTKGYNQATNYLLDPSGSAQTALTGGYGQARNDLGSQYGQTQGYLGGLQGLYQPLVNSGQQATDARADALGLNGADGNARAQTAFTGSLGYNAGLNTGLDAVTRSAAARGMLASGNTSQDLFNYAADYQNRQAGSYINSLGTVANNLNTGLAGQATGLGAQANASQNYGSALSGLGTGLGTGLGSLYGQAAQNSANFGNAVAGLQTNAAGQYVNNNNTLAKGLTDASGNALGLGLGALQSVFGAAGNAGGFSNLFGSGGPSTAFSSYNMTGLPGNNVFK